MVFIRDLRIDGSAPAHPHDIVIPRSVCGWTAQDVLSKFGPDDPMFTAELYTVSIQCNRATLQLGARISGNLMSTIGPVPLGHLELVLKPMRASGDLGQLAAASYQEKEPILRMSKHPDVEPSHRWSTTPVSLPVHSAHLEKAH